MNATAVIALATLGLAVPTTAQIQWTKSVDDAVAKARSERKVIFVALNMDDERANDQMVEDHYRDPILVKLSRNTVNLFCSNNTHRKSGRCPRCKGTTCASHRDNDREVRRRFLKVDGDASIIAPQHLFVSPDGTIISSVPYFITKGELEWMWVDAIRELNTEFTWAASDRSRAPTNYRKGDVDKTKGDGTPPTEKEVQQALKDVKKLGGGGRGQGGRGRMLRSAQENARIIIRSDDKRALDWGQNTLRAYRRFRDELIRDIGKVSPKPWATIIEQFLDAKSADTRKTTAIALEGLGNPRSVNALRKATRNKAEENDVLGRMLRALAASGPDKAAAIATVTKAAKSHREPTVRAHAMVGVGMLEKRDVVTTSLRAGLQDTDPLVRIVTAYVIATRQDKVLLGHLIASTQAETEVTAKAWMEKAVDGVRTGETKHFRDFLPKILDGNDPGTELDRLAKAAARFLEPEEEAEERDNDKKNGKK